MKKCTYGNERFIDYNFYQYVHLDEYDNITISPPPFSEEYNCGKIVYDVVVNSVNTAG